MHKQFFSFPVHRYRMDFSRENPTEKLFRSPRIGLLAAYKVYELNKYLLNFKCTLLQGLKLKVKIRVFSDSLHFCKLHNRIDYRRVM